jgi:hypothetical protein
MPWNQKLNKPVKHKLNYKPTVHQEAAQKENTLMGRYRSLQTQLQDIKRFAGYKGTEDSMDIVIAWIDKEVIALRQTQAVRISNRKKQVIVPPLPKSQHQLP